MTLWTGTPGPPHLPRSLSATHYFYILKVKVQANERRMVQMFGTVWDWQPENTQKYNRNSCTAQAQLMLKVCFSLFPFVLAAVKWKMLCFLICSFTIGKMYYHLLQTSPVPCYKTAVNCRPKAILKVWNCCRSVHTSISQYLHCRIVSLWVPHVFGTGLKCRYILSIKDV